MANKTTAMIYHEHKDNDLLIIGDENGHINLFNVEDPRNSVMIWERSHPKFK